MTLEMLLTLSQTLAARALAQAVASGDVDAIVLDTAARVSGFSADALRHAAACERADVRRESRQACAEANALRVRSCERRAARKAAQVRLMDAC